MDAPLFYPWTGCTKISPACDHCYAESWAKRSGLVQWGPGAERRRTSDANWRQPLRWNAEAERLGVRYRVFCASLADVFDNTVPMQWRIALMKMICETRHLDWVLLTKRIGNASQMLETAFRAVHHQREGWADNAPPNVWIGATVCNQEEADRDIPKLLEVPAAKRFLSIEPLLGEIYLDGVPRPASWPPIVDDITDGTIDPLRIRRSGTRERIGIDWVIVGGESGPHARPMNPEWVRILRDDCAAAGVPFFFKQWGQWAPVTPPLGSPHYLSHAWVENRTNDNARTDELISYRVGKKQAGRLFDGRLWDEVPV